MNIPEKKTEKNKIRSQNTLNDFGVFNRITKIVKRLMRPPVHMVA